MNCPTCGEESAQILFNLTECINKECKNYSKNHAKEIENKKNWSNLTSVSNKEKDDIDEELDEVFQMTFGWTGP